MNVNPSAYPVHQMSQQPYGYHAPASRPPPQIQPQQSPGHTQFLPAVGSGSGSGSGSFPPNKQYHLHPQQQPPHPLPLPLPQSQTPALPPQQPFPPQQPYQQYQQHSQPFYGNSGNLQFSGNGVMQSSAQNVSPQVYASSSNSQAAPSLKPSEASLPVTLSQHSQGMAVPAAMPATNNPYSQRFSPQNEGIVQHSHSHNPPSGQAPNQPQTSSQQPQSPQSVAREKERVSVLLEINSYLIQEVVSLQAQGKAGGPPSSMSQQSPTQETAAGSPASATDPSNPLNNSPIDPAKPAGSKPPSQEYIECMRRLQANLAYLAAIADAKKKAAGSIPATPAIMAPPPHLSEVKELYKKLNSLFLVAAQAAGNKPMLGSGPRPQNVG